jgi:DNA polymerase V
MFLIPMENPDKIAIPLFLERCAAGFPALPRIILPVS